MTPHQQDLKAEAAKRVNMEYVERVGRETGAWLREGLPVAVPYEPGNATRYELVLTPMHEVAETPTTWPVASDCTRQHCVCVSIINEYHRAITLTILDPNFWIHPSYLTDKLGVSDGDALALLALFQEIAAQ